MIGKCHKALLLLVSISVSSSALAANPDKARDWLERMTLAMSQLTYQGTFVYVRNNAVESMRITHVVNDDGVRERLYSVSGPHREIIRDKQGVRCVLEDSGSVVKDPVVARSYFPELPLSAIDDPASAYRLEVLGTARIAGRKSRRISITPQDIYRYGYDFWLDEQTGLLVKWALKDSNHKVLAKLVFTDLVIGSDVDLHELEPEADASDFVELDTLSPQKTVVMQGKPQWHPKELPPGFRLTSYSHQRGNEGVFEHMVYGDGLAAVSVYMEKPGAGAPQIREGNTQLGTNNAYSRQLGGLQVTVIGEVPAITVSTIANNMVRTSKK